MLYQIFAYETLGSITLQVTTAQATDKGYAWEHRILETLDLPPGVTDDPWDVLWSIAQRISERAIERSRRQ